MIRCLAVDDEPLALEVIEAYCAKVPNIRLIDLCRGPMQALQVLAHTQVDLLLLDIEMPDLSGLQLLRMLKNPPLVILTTAYQEFALESYEVSALDYLLKPILFERFVQAIHKAQERLAPVAGAESHVLPTVFPTKSLFIKSEGRTIRLDISDILYVEGRKDYVMIYTSEKKWITQLTLAWIEERLISEGFVRIHRSYIVAIHKIDLLDRNSIQINGKHIPIGDFYRENLWKLIRG
ncbi:MAG: response regulator transcription factor [Siphonobacter aquaeclarae]|nr:response regulator transcription factor [Siphonobacter aquaeclarae]